MTHSEKAEPAVWTTDARFLVDGANGSDWLARLRELTRLAGGTLLTECGSTNDIALDSARNGNRPTPFLIWSLAQTRGRGRGGNVWHGSGGSLLFSLVASHQPGLAVRSEHATSPDFTMSLPDTSRPAGPAPRMALLAGLATATAIQRLAPRAAVGLKWPNDVLIDGAKVSGILTETVPGEASRVVFGIGVNVNSAPAADVALRYRATSLREQTSQEQSLGSVLVAILQELDAQFESDRSRPADLPLAWKRYCVLDQRPVRIDQAGESHIGVCRGIDGDGALLLQTPDGGCSRIIAGVVTPLD